MLEKLGINLNDKTQPYIYQLIKALDKTDNKTSLKKESSLERKINELETPILIEQKRLKTNKSENQSKISIEKTFSEDIFGSQTMGINNTVNTDAI